MVCRRYNDALNEMAAGGPAPQGFAAHLEACASCHADLARLRRMLGIADEELQELSTIEPSAGFVPRLRAVVIDSGAATGWRIGWLWPSLAGAAAVVLAIILLVADQPRPAAVVVAESTLPAPAATTPAPAPVHEATVGSPAQADDQATPPPARSRRSVPAGPQVLIPPGESEALMELIVLVNRVHLTPTALSAAGEPSAQLAMLPPIDIKPIEIVPLDTALTSGT